MQNPHFLLIAFLTIIIGIYVLFKGTSRNSQTKWAFFLISLSAAGWLVSLFFVTNLKENALLFARCVFAWGMLAPAALLHFVRTYPSKTMPFPKLIKYYAAGLIIIGLSTTPYIVATVKLNPWGAQVIAGPLYPLVLVYFVVYLTLIVREIVRNVRVSQKNQKIQWLFIAAGLPVPIIHILITNLILPRLGFQDIYKYGPIAALEMIIILGYSIIRYRLFDIEPLLKKTVYGLVAILLTTFVTVAANYIYQSVTGNAIRYDLMTVNLLITLALIVIMTRLKSKLDELTTRLAGQKSLARSRRLENIVVNMKKYTDKEQLFEYVAIKLKDIFNADTNMYIKDQAKGDYKLATTNGEKPLWINKNSRIIALLEEYSRIIEIDKIIHDPQHYGVNSATSLKVRQEAIHQEAALYIPLCINQELDCLLVMGGPRDHFGYTDQDMNKLDYFAAQVNATLENIHNFGQMMQENRLELIGTMAASFAHEIRNPLTGASTYLELLPEKKDKPGFMEKFNEIVPREIKRVLQLTTELLNFARSGKAQMEPVEIKSLFTRALTLLETDIKKKKIKVEMQMKSELALNADANQLYQVILNILLNAIQSSKKEGKVKITISAENDNETVEIQDEGEGISEENLKNIFEPFFSTKVYGTGLGLATCKRIIEAHSGRLDVESEMGRGSKFTIVLPLNLEKVTEESPGVIEKDNFTIKELKNGIT